jgi:cytochrome bd ubiquinol oxidase subunit I
MVEIQPMKMAAAEALWETEEPASFSLFTIGNMRERRDIFAIRIPRLLSLLAYNQLEGEVKGMNDLQAEYVAAYGPGNYIPPAVIPYWTFRIMVGAGFLMVGLSLYALFLVMGDLFEGRSLILKIFTFAITLPYLANSSGWLLTEVGRYPWTVFGLMTLEESISPTVSAGMVLTSLVGFILIYSGLIVATLYLITKHVKAGLPVAEKPEPEMPSLIGVGD